MFRQISQCIIQEYTGPRTFDAIQIPSGYAIKNVRLPNTIATQFKPLEKSIVFVIQADDYQAYFLSVVRDPVGFLENAGAGAGVRGSTEDDELQFSEGEVLLEAKGDPSSPLPGTGGVLHLGNDGTINMYSGKGKESIKLGGTDDDNDGEIVITADNGFFESNIDTTSGGLQSTVRFDESNKLEVGNFRVSVPFSGLAEDITEIPVVDMTMEPDGELTLANYNLLGIEQNKFNMTPTGTTSLDTINTNLTSTATTNIDATTLSLTATGTLSGTGNVINLNNGINGVARLSDTVLSNETNDKSGGLYWQAWVALMEILLGSPINEPGLGSPSALQAAIQAKLATEGVTVLTIPDEVQGKITSSSSSVKAGD